MFQNTLLVVLVVVGTLQENGRANGREMLRTGYPFGTATRDYSEPSEDSKLELKRDAESVSTDADKEKLAAALKHRADTIEQYRKEAVERMNALNERLKNHGSEKEEPKTTPIPVKSGAEKLDSDIQRLETELEDATAFLDEQKNKPKKKKKKTTTESPPPPPPPVGSGCRSVLGALGCLLG